MKEEEQKVEEIKAEEPLQKLNISSKRIMEQIAPRGPDYQSHSEAELEQCLAEFGRGETRSILYSCVLHLRGADVTPQPFRDATTGNTLQYNGEVFSAESSLNFDPTFNNDGE